MTPLEDLEQQSPVIDSHFRRFCASHGISSVEDFLVSDLYVLAALADRQPNSAALKEGIARVLSIVDGRHMPWRNGVVLLADAERNKHLLSTGLQGIDSLIGGGVREGELTELVGPSSCGKTQVCLCIAAHVAERYSGTVLFLDTGNSFSSQQIASIVGGQLSPSSTEVTDRRIMRVLSRIFCTSIYDIFALSQTLDQLDLTLKQQVLQELPFLFYEQSAIVYCKTLSLTLYVD